jgi:hypothetical protein
VWGDLATGARPPALPSLRLARLLLRLMDPREGITETQCPECGHVLDAAEAVDDPEVRPSPGDLSICIKCSAILIFTEDMSIRLATDAELDELAEDSPELHRQVRSWAARAARAARFWGEQN